MSYFTNQLPIWGQPFLYEFKISMHLYPKYIFRSKQILAQSNSFPRLNIFHSPTPLININIIQ